MDLPTARSVGPGAPRCMACSTSRRTPGSTASHSAAHGRARARAHARTMFVHARIPGFLSRLLWRVGGELRLQCDLLPQPFQNESGLCTMRTPETHHPMGQTGWHGSVQHSASATCEEVPEHAVSGWIHVREDGKWTFEGCATVVDTYTASVHERMRQQRTDRRRRTYATASDPSFGGLNQDQRSLSARGDGGFLGKKKSLRRRDALRPSLIHAIHPPAVPGARLPSGGRPAVGARTRALR